MAGWRNDKPTVGAVVEVWYSNQVILATWDGKEWKTVDGAPLWGISHWRKKSY